MPRLPFLELKRWFRQPFVQDNGIFGKELWPWIVALALNCCTRTWRIEKNCVLLWFFSRREFLMMRVRGGTPKFPKKLFLKRTFMRFYKIPSIFFKVLSIGGNTHATSLLPFFKHFSYLSSLISASFLSIRGYKKRECLLTRLGHLKCIRLCVQVTSNVKVHQFGYVRSSLHMLLHVGSIATP